MSRLRPVEEPDEATAQPEEEGEGTGQRPFVERWILPYVEDPALWPVLLVVIAHVVVFLAPLELYAVRDFHVLSIGVLLWLAFMSVQAVRDEVRHIGRFGTIGWLLAVTWALSFVAAYFGGRWDII